MATKVQSKSYLPGYYSMQNIKEDATSSWSNYYQDKKISEHLYNSYVPGLANGYAEHDKEMLKRTMLEHEAIFRTQVYELHRLYRIQKDLMNEFQSRGFCRSSILTEASHSNSFSSQMRSACTEKILQMSRIPVGNTSYGKTTFAGTERLQFSFTREGSVQSDQIPLLNGASRKDTKALDCRSQKRRALDLQLLADVYIEDTDGYGQTKIVEPSSSASIPKNGTCSPYSENDVKLTLGRSHREDCHISNSPTQIGISACSTVDLNQPTTEVGFERPVNSASVQLLGLKAHSEQNHGHHSFMRSSTSFMDRHADQHSTSDFLFPDVHTKREWPFFNHESGKTRSTVDFFTQTSYNDNIPTSGETLQLHPKKCHENFSFNHDKPETWSRQEPTHNIQTSARVPYFTCSNSALMSPSMPSSITTPQADLTSCASSFVSSWRTPATSISKKPIAVQALPSFSVSSNLSNESLSSKRDTQIPVTCEKWQNSRNLTTSLRSGIGVPCTNGFHHGLHLDSNSVPHPKLASGKPDQIQNCNGDLHGHLPGNHVKGSLSKDLKTPINMNLNQAFPSGIEDRLTIRQDTVICDVESKYDKLSGGPSWLRKKSSNESVDLKKHASKMDLSFSNGHPQLNSSSNVAAPEIDRKEERWLDFSLCNLQEVTSNSQFKDHKKKGNEVSDNNLIHDTYQQSNMSVSVRRMEKPLTDSARFRNHINLNAEFACTDDPTSSEIFPQGEVVVRSSSSTPSFGAKMVSDIDLEAPISQAEMGVLDQQKYISSSKKYGSEEKDSSGDTLVRLAAENLVAISLDCNGHSDEINSHPLYLPGFDTLSWFAEVVSCSAENPKLLANGGYGCTQSLDNNGFDLFEVMTLNLEETKMDHHWPRPKEIENKDEKEDREDIGAASLLFTRPRRGQARKRRQRRDFQKDILPGLASLSRHEVTEDLQTIEGMMKASGRPWQTGSTRRNMSRNGLSSRTKGRRQLRSSDITIKEIRVTPPPPSQPCNSEVGVDRRSMIGWGRTTRRCRRPRCPLGSLPAPLT